MKEWTKTFSDFALVCICLLCWRSCVLQAGKQILTWSDKTIVFLYCRIWKTSRFILCEDLFYQPCVSCCFVVGKNRGKLTEIFAFSNPQLPRHRPHKHRILTKYINFFHLYLTQLGSEKQILLRWKFFERMNEWTKNVSEFALVCIYLLCWRSCVLQSGK